MHSHVHALGQCRKLIRQLGLTPVVAADTAGAARELAESGDKTRAAIATALAGEIYGLEILRRDIEDEEHNTTRFIVLSAAPHDAEPEDKPVMTSFVFRVRNVPAALYKAMGGFATNGINMTKLESYQLEGHFSATQFYADIEGHPCRPLGAARARGARILHVLSARARRLQGQPLSRRDRPAHGGASVCLTPLPAIASLCQG